MTYDVSHSFNPLPVNPGIIRKKFSARNLIKLFVDSPIAISCIHIESNFSIPLGESVKSETSFTGLNRYRTTVKAWFTCRKISMTNSLSLYINRILFYSFFQKWIHVFSKPDNINIFIKFFFQFQFYPAE